MTEKSSEENILKSRLAISLAQYVFDGLSMSGLDSPTLMAACIIALFDLSRHSSVKIEAMEYLMEKSKKSYRDYLELVQEIQKEQKNELRKQTQQPT